MQKKEVVIVAACAFVLSNLAIVGTLMAKGHFDSGEPEPVEVAEVEEEPQDTETPPEENTDPNTDPNADPNAAKPSPADYVHHMAEAMYICEEKFLTSTANIRKSYEFKHSESHFSEEEELYRVFIEYETVGEPANPALGFSVVCEVSAPKRAIASYKVLPL